MHRFTPVLIAQYADSGLQPDTTYYYEVRSYTGTGNSAFSSPVSVITLPATPTGLGASATGSQSTSVSWNTVSGVTGYTLDRSDVVRQRVCGRFTPAPAPVRRQRTAARYDVLL